MRSSISKWPWAWSPESQPRHRSAWGSTYDGCQSSLPGQTHQESPQHRVVQVLRLVVHDVQGDDLAVILFELLPLVGLFPREEMKHHTFSRQQPSSLPSIPWKSTTTKIMLLRHVPEDPGRNLGEALAPPRQQLLLQVLLPVNIIMFFPLHLLDLPDEQQSVLLQHHGTTFTKAGNDLPLAGVLHSTTTPGPHHLVAQLNQPSDRHDGLHRVGRQQRTRHRVLVQHD